VSAQAGTLTNPMSFRCSVPVQGGQILISFRLTVLITTTPCRRTVTRRSSARTRPHSDVLGSRNLGHFLDINPKGLVPAIEFHGKPLRESLVVAEFGVEDAFPRAPRLLPSDPFARGRMGLWIDHASKQVVPAFFRALQAQEPDAQRDGVDALSAALRELADEVGGPYFFGEQFTLIDAVVAPVRVGLVFLGSRSRTVSSSSATICSQRTADTTARR
jgi:hypothetical protein